MSPTTVFVSGATGFLAQHICQQLIDRGYYVVGSVRSAEKGQDLKKLLKSDNFSFEIVPDIVAEGAFDEALKNNPQITAFMHTASPVAFSVESIEDELLKPAIMGTKNALLAIKAHGTNVKKVVVTSSVSAMRNTATMQDGSITLTEESWNPMSHEEALKDQQWGCDGSKTFAEKAAWDFVKIEKPNFTLSTVCPAYIFGPQAFDENVKGTMNYSAEIINSIIKLSPDDKLPSLTGGMVDVRDVAHGHIVAIEKDEAAGKRIWTDAGTFCSQSIADILYDNFAELRGKIPRGQPGTGPEIMAKECNKHDSSKSKALLGFELISLEKSVVDTAAQIAKVTGFKV